jgi:hypothetical protein
LKAAAAAGVTFDAIMCVPHIVAALISLVLTPAMSPDSAMKLYLHSVSRHLQRGRFRHALDTV